MGIGILWRRIKRLEKRLYIRGVSRCKDIHKSVKTKASLCDSFVVVLLDTRMTKFSATNAHSLDYAAQANPCRG